MMRLLYIKHRAVQEFHAQARDRLRGMNERVLDAERMLHHMAELTHEELKALARRIASDPKKIQLLRILNNELSSE